MSCVLLTTVPEGGESSNEEERAEGQEEPEDAEAVFEGNHDEGVADLNQGRENTPPAPEGDSEEEDEESEDEVEHPESKNEVMEEEVNYPDTTIDLSHLQSQR